MSQFDFDFVERFDEELAAEGRKFDVYAENGTFIASFTCAFYSFENRKVKLIQERVRRSNLKDIRIKGENDPDLSERMAREVFVEAVLQDWSGVTSKGKPVPFTKEAAMACFSHDKGKFVFGKLLGESMDINNFQGEDKEEVAGN